jgi:catechol 2,3-dioxygenase-like lactoylglutathione lyase family enzyme
MNQPLNFQGGRNIAIKVPPHQHEATVRFYRDTLGLRVVKQDSGTVAFEFGAIQLWIDRVATASHAEVWLEVITSDGDKAASHLRQAGTTRRDELEALPEGMRDFWVSSPSSVIHLVCDRRDTM